METNEEQLGEKGKMAVLAGFLIFFGFLIFLRINWQLTDKCQVPGCRNEKFKYGYCAEHYCKGWRDSPCYNLRMEGSPAYCAEHAYCAYEGCKALLKDGEDTYCVKHEKAGLRAEHESRIALEEANKRYKKEEASREAAEKAIEESKKNEIRRREHAAYAAIHGNSSGSYNSYSDYDDVYDDVLGDIGDGDW